MCTQGSGVYATGIEHSGTSGKRGCVSGGASVGTTVRARGRPGSATEAVAAAACRSAIATRLLFQSGRDLVCGAVVSRPHTVGSVQRFRDGEPDRRPLRINLLEGDQSASSSSIVPAKLLEI